MCVRVPILYNFSNRIFETILTCGIFVEHWLIHYFWSNLCMCTCLLDPNVATCLTTPLFIEFLYQGRKVSGHVSLSSKSSYWKCFVRLQLCQLSMIDIQLTTKNEYYDHIALLYLKTRKCLYQSIIFVWFYLYIAVVIFIDYSDMGKMMDINNDKC